MISSYGLMIGHEAIRHVFSLDLDQQADHQLRLIRPDDFAPVIRTAADGSRIAQAMRWGFPPNPRSSLLTTSVREPDAPYWWRWLPSRGHRCLVPATEFSVMAGWSTKNQRERRISIAGERPLCAFAGVWRPWTGARAGGEGEHLLFAILTCRPNRQLASIRARSMPALMTADEDFDAWLTSPWEIARQLVQPYPAESMLLLD
jgi:putative SOS response-associated peptidase YedK